MTEKGVLYLIACATRVASRIDGLIVAAQQAGWDVCVIVTPKALNFIDKERLESLTNRPVRHDYKRPEEPDLFPPANALIVFPATFNTVNKLGAGISDTLALGLINEYIGRRKPVVIAPTLSTGNGLDSHPIFLHNLALLRGYGAHVIYEPKVYPPRNEVPADILLQALDALM